MLVRAGWVDSEAKTNEVGDGIVLKGTNIVLGVLSILGVDIRVAGQGAPKSGLRDVSVLLSFIFLFILM